MWADPQFLVDLVTFTEEILNIKLHLLCGARSKNKLIGLYSFELQEKFKYFSWLWNDHSLSN